MADTTDINADSRRFQGQLDKLETADIADSDRDAIRAFIRQRDAHTSTATSTDLNHLKNLRLSADRSDMALTDMEKSDVDDLLFQFKHERGMADGTLRNYRKSLRLFYRDGLGREWAEEIKVGPSPTRKADPDDALNREETDALLDAARNPRDKALLAMLLDGGFRKAAVASLRVRDVDLSGRAGRVMLNQDASGLKGADGPKALTWSTPYLAAWLDVHPRRDDPNAALFHTLREPHEVEDDGALTPFHFQRILKGLAEDADVPREKVNPHNFRKTAITRWIREGLSEQEIKHRAGWVKDSGQFEVYSQVSAEEMNGQILNRYGFADEETVGTPTLKDCPRCRTPLRSRVAFCPSCGLPLSDRSVDIADATGEIKDDTADAALGDDLTSEEREGMKALLAAVNDPAALAAKLAGTDTEG